MPGSRRRTAAAMMMMKRSSSSIDEPPAMPADRACLVKSDMDRGPGPFSKLEPTATGIVTMDEQAPKTRDQPPGQAAGAAAHDGHGSAALLIDDQDRYSRLRLISWWRQERLRTAQVLVVGAGALGNEVMKNLALLGLGTTYLIDFDVVEPSNLSRSVLFREEDGGHSKAVVAARRARELNPEINIVPLHGDVITDLGLGLFAAVDLVIGCLDNREARLWVNRQCWKTGTPWIDAGIQEIQGVVKVFVPPDSACYECAMTKRDYELLNFRYSCPLLTRDQISAGKVPTAPTIASMMAALQVQEALKLLHGMPVAAGSALVYNGVANQFYSTRLPFREDCLSHETYPKPVELFLGRRNTVHELFAAARSSMEGRLRLVLDRELVVAIDCPRCSWRGEVMRPRVRVKASEATCPNCNEPGRPEFASAVDEDSPLAAQELSRVGIPPYDIVRVDGPAESGFFLLAADREECNTGWGLGR
jgi:molybdopterin-synthase adenylyltransferase